MLKDALLKLFKLDGLVNNLTGYVETRIELLKYEIKEDMAKAISRLSLVLLTAMFFIFFLLFISVSIAVKIGETLGTFVGFGIVAGFYFVLMMIIVLFRESISKSLEEKIKKHITHPAGKEDPKD
jgi:uncharacterized membrane protein YqjE